MSSRYDSKTNSFDREGRLMQVENALKAINKMGASVGILTKEGVILTCERQDVSFLLEQQKQSEKIYKVDDHIYSVVGGIQADSNYLIDDARLNSARFRYKFSDDMPLEQLVIHVCDIKQSYTHFGGKRPFGASFLFAGYDKQHGYQIYSTDPSGNYAGWQAHTMGNNNLLANSFLKQEYKEDLSLEQGLQLAVKALVKTLDTASPSSKKIEVLVISQNKDGKVEGKNLSETEIDDVLKRSGFNQEDEKK